MLTAKRLSAVCAASILALAGLAAQPSSLPGGGKPAAGAPRVSVKKAPGGDGATNPGGDGAPAPTAETPPGENEPRFSLDFQGGTVREYATVLREVTNANVVVSVDAEDLPVGQVSLKGVTVADAVQVIGTARRMDGNSWGQATVERRGDIFLVRDGGGRSPGGGHASSGHSPSSVTVFALGVAGSPEAPPEMTLSAIEAALRMIDSPTSKTQISFHRESGLLFVVADTPALATVENVIQGLGARGRGQLLGEELNASHEIQAVLGVPDLVTASKRIKELVDMKKQAESLRLEAVMAQAKFDMQGSMMQRELKELQDRLAKQADEARKVEDDARAKVEQVREKLADENRALRAEMNELANQLRAAKGTK